MSKTDQSFPRVGIVIPTMNRLDFIVRQLKYYASVDCRHAIYIGDASEPEISEATQREIKKLSKVLDVHYYYWPALSDRETIYRLVCEVKEDFASYIGDDDFFIPNGLTRCATFLKSNPTYRTAQGRAVLFSLRNSGAYGRLDAVSDYWQKPCVEQETALERIMAHAKCYWVPQFSVHRTQEFIEDMKNYPTIPDRSFGELLSCFPIVSNGKSKFVDCLYLMRQGHDARYTLPDRSSWRNSAAWAPSFNIFCETLASSLVRQDEILSESSFEMIKSFFETYFMPKPQANKKLFINKLKQTLKKSIVLRYIERIVRANRSDMTYFALRKKNSPYSRDFYSVCKVLTANSNKADGIYEKIAIR